MRERGETGEGEDEAGDTKGKFRSGKDTRWKCDTTEKSSD